VELLVEDRYRYNIFRDSSGVGDNTPTSGLYAVFNVSDEGMPLLDPYPVGVLSLDALSSLLNGRFRRFNTSRRIEINQPNHDFYIDDVLSVTESGYVKTTSENAGTSFGRVIEADSNPNTVSVITNSKLIENSTIGLQTKLGDYLYIDENDSGKLTNVKNGAALYLTVVKSVDSFVESDTSSDDFGLENMSPGDTLSINNVDVTFDSITFADIIDDINELTAEHGVSASILSATTLAVSKVTDTAFGGVFVGTNPPGSARINNVLVTFSTSDSGGAFGDENDVAADINSANIPNITAEGKGGLIYIYDSSGSPIEIENVTNEEFGNPIAGEGSATGLPLSTPASTDNKIRLTHADGMSIVLKNTVGVPRESLGLFSVDNGVPVHLMPISSTGISGSMTTIVVPDIDSRDALIPSVGQQVYVIDAEQDDGSKSGEWALYIWDGSVYVKISDEDSASTDANTMSLSLGFEDQTGDYELGVVSENSRVTLITIIVESPFDGNPILNIGDSDQNDRLMSDDLLDLSVIGTYITTTDYLYDNGDTSIVANFDNGSSTEGSLKIVISYQ